MPFACTGRAPPVWAPLRARVVAPVRQRMTGETQRMADSSIGFERSIDSATYSPVPGRDRGISDRNSRPSRPVEADKASRADLASVLKAATLKQNMGEDAEAEGFFRQALEMADETMAPDDPELMLLLTDLTRFYLRKSSFASAEPLLLRLTQKFPVHSMG